MPSPLPNGTVINGYRFDGVLSDRGNFSIVYDATDTNPQRVSDRTARLAGRLGRWATRFGPQAAQTPINPGPQVAIKEFAPKSGARRSGHSITPAGEHAGKFQWSLGRFRAEINFLRDHSHPNVLAIFDLFDTNRTSYMVMERLDGGTLEDLVAKEGPQDEAGVRTWLLPVLAALCSIESRGANHLDISPNNIMFRQWKDGPVIVDFGASKIPCSEASGSAAKIIDHHFSAPEKINSDIESLDASCDVYSVAGCIYYAMTGRHPVKSGDRRQNDDSDIEIPPAASPEFIRIFRRAFSLNRDDRYPNSTEFAEDVARLPAIGLDEASESFSGPEATSPYASPLHDVTLLALGGLTVFVMFLIGWILLRWR